MDGWVWSNGGMILTGENWSTRRETLYSVGGKWMNGYGAMVEWYWHWKTEVLGEKTLYSVGGRWMDEYGAMVEWYWQGKTELLGGKHYTVSVVDWWMSVEQRCPILTRKDRHNVKETSPSAASTPQTSYRLSWNRTRACAVRGQRLTDWVMERPTLILTTERHKFHFPPRSQHTCHHYTHRHLTVSCCKNLTSSVVKCSDSST